MGPLDTTLWEFMEGSSWGRSRFLWCQMEKEGWIHPREAQHGRVACLLLPWILYLFLSWCISIFFITYHALWAFPKPMCFVSWLWTRPSRWKLYIFYVCLAETRSSGEKTSHCFLGDFTSPNSFHIHSVLGGTCRYYTESRATSVFEEVTSMATACL